MQKKTTIADVINADRATNSARKAGFFTVAAKKAKAKLSEYALPDPFYYSLELIQSAVALGASVIDITTDEMFFIIAFQGKSFTKDDLAHMFDYLLVTEQEDHFRARRRLAIGLAAALSLYESKVIVETGDGTLDGSHRFELSNIHADPEICRPDAPIEGTVIHVYHSLYSPVLGDVPREKITVLEHCEHLPATLIIDGEMPFGAGTGRRVELHGYKYKTDIDEGDLYGAVALPSERNDAVHLSIQTNGVSLSRLKIDTPLGPVQGVLTFDRIHKTASQYEIVQDDRLFELESRLWPYIYDLLVDAGVSNADRAAYLFTKPLPRISGVGEPFSFAPKCFDAARPPSFRLTKTRSDKMTIYVALWMPEGKSRLIRKKTFDFHYPVNGTLYLWPAVVDHIRFVHPKGKRHVRVVLTPAFWETIQEELHIAEKRMRAFFKKEMAKTHDKKRDQRLNPGDLNRSTSSKTPGVVRFRFGLSEDIADLTVVNTKAPVSATSTHAYAPRQLPRPFASQVTKQKSAAAAMRDRERPPTPYPTVPTASEKGLRMATQPSPKSVADAGHGELRVAETMPLSNEIVRLLKDAVPVDNKNVLQLIGRMLLADGENADFMRFCRYQLLLTSEETQRAPAWVQSGTLEPSERHIDAAGVRLSLQLHWSTSDDGDSGDLFIVINAAHPLLKRWLSELPTIPFRIFNIVLLLGNALARQTKEMEQLPDFKEEKLVAHILACLDNPIYSTP